MLSADSPRTARLAWLDALRGLGAIAVVIEHLNYTFLPEFRPKMINLGIYGVLVFFLVSGYIIPASLERRGDVRAFWLGRLFRLYPLYLLSIVIVVAMVPVHRLRADLDVFAHITMLMEVTGSSGATEPMWTLSYEMVFYLLVTALFVAGVHRRSGLSALLFGLLSVVVAFALPIRRGLLDGPVVPIVALVVIGVALGCVLFGPRLARVAGAITLGVGSVVLVAIGSRVPWQGAMILAVMFTGTAVYRWEHRQGSGLWPVAGVAFLVCLIPFLKPVTINGPANLLTMALAGGTFALFMALRERRFPRLLAWLGMISYSVYLLHMPVVRLYFSVFGTPGDQHLLIEAGIGVALIAAICGVSWLTYRFVELPMQQYGRRLAKRLPASSAPARQPAGV